MADAINLSWLGGQHGELLPARVVMSAFVCGTGVLGNGSGSEGGASGGAGGAGGNSSGGNAVTNLLFGGGGDNAGVGGAGGAAQGGAGAPLALL